MKNSYGFTLVEAVIALLLGSLMMMGIYAAVDSAQNSSSKLERRVVAQQDARSALELMVVEIGMASYNSSLRNIWMDPANCVNPSSNQLNKGIQTAQATLLVFEMDINESGIVGDFDNEIISYGYDSANKYIWRETRRQGTCANNRQPFLGATNASPESKTVLVENNAAGVPVFRYYNGAGTELTTPVTTSIPDIRRIEITLVADSQYADPKTTNTRKRVIYSSSVVVRNHIPVPNYNN